VTSPSCFEVYMVFLSVVFCRQKFCAEKSQKN